MNPNSVTTIQDVTPAMVAPSKTNPRKTFAKIDELAASIKLRGLISPITVRPHPKPPAGVHYELVAGERRWRAAKLAKVTTIPAIVRELTDKEVLEIQVIENVQREDVHPMEEAEGYEELISKHGYDVDQIAAKTGKSKAYVYGRLKLCSLGEYARKAFLEDRLNASIALLIARIPDLELQKRATHDVLGETVDDPDGRPEEDPDDLDDPNSPLWSERRTLWVPENLDGSPTPGTSTREIIPMSVREAQIHLQRRYMLRLAVAKFDVSDPRLVPTASACGACEFRTGNQRDLFADVDSDDICTKPSCFEAKTRAAWEAKAAEAEAAGLKVVTADKAASVFTPSAQVRPTSPFVDPKAPVPHDLLPAEAIGKKAPTWEKLVGKKLLEQAPKVLVQDGSGAAHELLDKKKLVELAREAGKIDKPLKPEKSSSSSGSKDPYKDQQARDEQKRDQWTRAVRAALIEAHEKAGDVDMDRDSWSWVLHAIVAVTGTSTLQGIDADVDELLSKKRLSPEHLLLSLLLEDAAQLPRHEGGQLWSDPAKDKELMSGLELVGVDYAKHLERIKASDKEAAKAEKKLVDAKKKGGR